MNRMTNTFLTAPVQIAPTCKTVEAAKKALAEAMDKIAANDAEIEVHRKDLLDTETEIGVLKKATPADISARIDRDRQALRLKIRLGRAPESDLAKFDKDAAEKQKAIAKQSAPKEKIAQLEKDLKTTNEAIAGLTAEGVRLLEVRRIAARDLYKAGAEAAGEEYIRLANEVKKIVAVAEAYGGLLKNLNFPNQIGDQIGEISFMPLGLDATHNRVPFFSTNEMSPLMYAAKEEILAGLAAEGLELFPPPKVAPPRKVREQEGGIPFAIVRPEDDRFPDGFRRPAQAITD